MRSLLRSWLVWLMVLALPLQGLAGTALQHCATAPRQVAHDLVSQAMHSEHLQMQEQPHQHQHQHAAAGPGHDHGPAADRSSAAHADLASAHAAGGNHHCSACAACCSVMGMPTWATPLAAPTIVLTAAALPRVVVDSFVPAGLDRPPRHHLG
jgi:Flp pilus assembly protein TadB